jgi:magnesium chelatase family protein
VIAHVHTGTLLGVTAQGVVVEISQTRGLPGFDVVGLPEAALRESRVRVMAAISNSGFQLPDRHFIVNLAPADLRKSGASFDLAIAIALLCACGMCPSEGLEETLLLGELSLDGRVRPVRGVLAQLRSAQGRGLTRAIIPSADASWGALAQGHKLRVLLAHTLRQVVEHCDGRDPLSTPADRAEDSAAISCSAQHDLRDVIGQEAAKRALEVAAAGGHHLLMVGPPGAGKTMLASRLPGLLPAPSPEEALEIATIASVAGALAGPECGWTRPFRAPHHSCSEVALLGGGHPVRPGEVTLAHGGVLFLDELPEFRRSAIESLRPTMESGFAVIARARERVIMPARPLLVAAMNPCPCGYAGDDKRVCRCSFDQVQRYRARVSGPMIDRFDLHVKLAAVPVQALDDKRRGESSAQLRTRIERAHAQAAARATEPTAAREPDSALMHSARSLLVRCIDSLNLSLRAYTKVLRVSRTLADLEGTDAVHSRHVAEAVQYRLLDAEAQAPSAHAPEPSHTRDS